MFCLIIWGNHCYSCVRLGENRVPKLKMFAIYDFYLIWLVKIFTDPNECAPYEPSLHQSIRNTFYTPYTNSGGFNECMPYGSSPLQSIRKIGHTVYNLQLQLIRPLKKMSIRRLEHWGRFDHETRQEL